MERWPRFPNDSQPSDREIRHALESMLTSAQFNASEKHPPILRFLVKSTILDEEVTENILLGRFFEGHEKQRLKGKPQNIVRVTITGLRKRIDDYYREEGYGDLVRIDIPAEQSQKGQKRPGGQAYKASFSYNPTHPADQEYRTGLYYLSLCTPADDALALDHFGFALKATPNFAPAHAGRAEVYLRWAMYHPHNSTTAENLRLAEEALERALRSNPRFWKAHSLAGALHACRWDWKKPRESFDRALEEDPYRTRYAAWHYPAFLAATGDMEEALLVLKERMTENPEDFAAQLAYGFFLYAAGRLGEAVFPLALAFAMSPRNWLVRLASALLALAQREPATPYMIVVRQLVGDDLMPGVTLLCHAADRKRRKKPEQWGPGRRLATDELFSSVDKALDEIADRLPTPAKQLAGMIRYAKEKHLAPAQLALGYLGTRSTAGAVKALERACDEHDPLMA